MGCGILWPNKVETEKHELTLSCGHHLHQVNHPHVLVPQTEPPDILWEGSLTSRRLWSCSEKPLTALLIFHLFFLQPSGSRTGWLIIEWVLPLNSYLSRTRIQHEIVCAELPTLHSSALFILASSWSHYVYLIQFVNNTYVYVRHIKDYMFLW